jgi:gluconokinase
MGVSGSGKTTVGKALAERWGVEFVDADDLHPESNRRKMSSGTPLDDDDRRPWLQDVAAWLGEHPQGGVTACSALKRSYRDLLRGDGEVRFVLLHGDRDLLESRLQARQGHFMPSSLLDSQLDTLEPLRPDEPGVVVDIALGVDEVVAAAVAALADLAAHPGGR